MRRTVRSVHPAFRPGQKRHTVAATCNCLNRPALGSTDRFTGDTPGSRGVVGHDSGPAWGMPWLTGVDQTGPARCGDAGRSSRRSSACWTAQQGQGQVLLVEGEPGTGKSLLLARADEEAGHRGFLLVAAAVNAARATRGNGAGRRETTAPARGPTWCSPGWRNWLPPVRSWSPRTTSSGPIQPPRKPSGPCHGCWRPTRRPGSWPWARQLTPVRPSCC
jgi:hypothetical protein